MKKSLALVLCLGMLAGIFTGCGGGGTSSAGGAASGGGDAGGDRKVKDTVTIVNELEPDTMDPCRGNGVSNNLVMGLVYDSLVKLQDDGEVKPQLATSWEFIDDTHIRFKLRENVKFSNGSDFTASDVLFSLARTKDEPTAQSTMTWYDEVNSVAEDDHTVVLAMHFPYAPIFYVLQGGRTWIGDEQTMNEVGADAYARNPVGTGPYTLKEWVSGSSLTLTANPGYWGEQPKTPNVVVKIVAEPTSRVIEMETKAADQVLYIASSDKERVDSIEGYHVESGPSEKYYLICLAMDNEKFKDERVRYALSHAIDLKELVDGSFDGGAAAMTGVYPSIVEGWKDLGGWEYNPEKAKELLKEAGYENGLELELHILPGTDYQRMAQIVQAYWAEIGVTAKIEQSALATREAQGPWEASIRTATATEISNILIIYEKAFASRLAPNDDHLEEMLQELKQTYDADARKILLSDIQDYIYKIRYSIPFAEVETIYGISDKVEGYKFSPRIDRQNIVDWVVYE